MTTSPSSSAQAAREAVATRLRGLMRDAGLNGAALAKQCGWSESKSSRILRAKTPPSDSDIEAWCQACHAEAEIPDLIAANQAADAGYVQWKRLHRQGMRQAQVELVPLFEETRVCRAYCSNVMPGMVQTFDYATALMTSITAFQGTPDDVPAAAAARLERSHVIYDGDHRFVLLIEESVLRARIADDDTMAAQLGFLLEAMALPRVAIGIIPFDAPRTIWPLEAFYIFDSHRVNVELLSAAVNITAPTEVAAYSKAFEILAEIAVYGGRARAKIAAAIEALT